MSRFPDYVHPNGQPWLATPRSESDVLFPTARQARTGVPQPADGNPLAGKSEHRRSTGTPYRGVRGKLCPHPPYRQAHPMMAHPVAVPDFGQQPRYRGIPPESRAVRRALIGVLLIVVALAASLVKVS